MRRGLQLVDRVEAARLLGGISVRTVIRLEAAGRLHAIRILRRVCYRVDEIERLIARQSRRPTRSRAHAR